MRPFLVLAALAASSNALAAGCPTWDVSVAGFGNVLTGDTCGAGDDVAQGCASSGSEEVTAIWYAFNDGTYRFDTIGSSYDTQLEIRDPACTSLDCDDDSGGSLTSSIEVFLPAGNWYYADIGGFGADCGTYLLNITDLGACADGDGDGVCDGQDLCFGDDSFGDSDFDGLCDDLDFTLYADTIMAGQPFGLYAYNAPIGARVFFLLGQVAGLTCHPNGAPCVDISRPIVLGSTTADASGFAGFTRVAPAQVPGSILIQSAELSVPTTSNLIVQ